MSKRRIRNESGDPEAQDTALDRDLTQEESESAENAELVDEFGEPVSMQPMTKFGVPKGAQVPLAKANNFNSTGSPDPDPEKQEEARATDDPDKGLRG